VSFYMMDVLLLVSLGRGILHGPFFFVMSEGTCLMELAFFLCLFLGYDVVMRFPWVT
jgi:hypothetical protein